MWPRSGGNVGPPTPLTPEVDRFELTPRRSSPPPVGPRVARIAPTHYQRPLQMPLEPRISPRCSYERMLRRIHHPYRVLTLSERMNRYRPVLPALQEEEASDQRSNIDIRQTPPRIVTKRQGQIYPLYPPNTQVRGSPSELMHFTEARSFPRFPHNDWLRRQSSWQQPDAPEIIITSDVQMQTDDNETGFDSLSVLVQRPSSSTEIADSSNGEFESASTQTEPASSTPRENSLQSAATLDVETETNPPNNLVENHITQQVETAQSDVTESYSRPSSSKECVSTNQSLFNKSLRMFTSAAPCDARPRLLPALPTATFKAKQVASSVIKHARNNKTINKKAVHCLNCKYVPVLPVTGLCGHTRCTKCIELYGDCPCGAQAPKDLHVNTVIQYLIGEMLPSNTRARRNSTSELISSVHDASAPISSATSNMPSEAGPAVRRVYRQGRVVPGWMRRASDPLVNTRMPISPQAQYEYARRLLLADRHRDAAPHLARVAASSGSRAQSARNLLAQVIMVLAGSGDPRRVARDLFRAVRLQATANWLRPADLECVLCYHTYTRPVTTPCGHVYCRTCIERALDYRKACALCQRPLDDFDLSATRETVFVTEALESIDALNPQLPLDPDVIPIFVCTVAYPSIPCPLFIFDPRYWLMIRRVLESGSRMFGMVAYERDRSYSEYGTVLEVCDCVHLEDGRSFLSTVGVSRFRIIERDVRDGCDVARIQPLTDITPTENDVVFDMRCLGSQILYKALVWLNGMNSTVRSEIESAFGEIPRFDDVGDRWWNSPDGPAWLWWLIAILPLRSEIKVLILSTKNLMKRMMAVARTLEAIDQVAITTTATSECEIRSALTNAEEWLERGS